uniref:Uncharacterized protein n=1 Tax=Anguilla anguilla TaxID=7936 RepID=A0A0E9V3B3_ANGAN
MNSIPITLLVNKTVKQCNM